MIESCGRAEGVETASKRERALVGAILGTYFGDAVAAVAQCAMLHCDGITLKELERQVAPKHQHLVRRATAAMIQHGVLMGARPAADAQKPGATKPLTYKVCTRNVTARLRYARMLEAAERKWTKDEATVLRYLLERGRSTTRDVLEGVLFRVEDGAATGGDAMDDDGGDDDDDDGDGPGEPEVEWEPSTHRASTALLKLVERGAATRVEWFVAPDDEGAGVGTATASSSRGHTTSSAKGGNGASNLFDADVDADDGADVRRAQRRYLEAELGAILPLDGDATNDDRHNNNNNTNTNNNNNSMGSSSRKRKRDDDRPLVWRARLHPLRIALTHEACEMLVENKLNAIAKEIVSAMLSLGAYKREPRARARFSGSEPLLEDEGFDNAVSVRQLTAELTRRHRDSSKLTEYLERLQYDSVGFVKKLTAGARRANARTTTGSSAAMSSLASSRTDDGYLFDLPTVVDQIRKATVHAVLLERYGPEAARVHRVLSQHKYLEQADLAEKSLLPPKDARERLYKLFSDDLVTLVEVAPSAKATVLRHQPAPDI